MTQKTQIEHITIKKKRKEYRETERRKIKKNKEKSLKFCIIVLKKEESKKTDRNKILKLKRN